MRKDKKNNYNLDRLRIKSLKKEQLEITKAIQKELPTFNLEEYLKNTGRKGRI